MNDALGLGLLIVKHLSHTPTISRHLILFFSILTSLILFLYYFFFSFLYGMAVNDNEFAAAVLRPPGGICDARWRGPPNPQCPLAEVPDRVRENCTALHTQEKEILPLPLPLSVLRSFTNMICLPYPALHFPSHIHCLKPVHALC